MITEAEKFHDLPSAGWSPEESWWCCQSVWVRRPEEPGSCYSKSQPMSKRRWTEVSQAKQEKQE